MDDKKRKIEITERFIFAPDILIQTLEEESIMVNLKSENIFGLNETGSLIAGFISDELPFGEMLEALNDKYEVSAKELERETTEILLTLIDNELILQK